MNRTPAAGVTRLVSKEQQGVGLPQVLLAEAVCSLYLVGQEKKS